MEHQVTLGSQPVIVRIAAIREIMALRHAILRPGLPPQAAIFPGDDEPTTLHIGAFLGERCVGCASFMLNVFEGQPAWQLRGMATAEDLRGQGVGKALVRFAEAELPGRAAARVMWCNARVAAVGFYRKQGWSVVSEVFEVVGVGPHYRMAKAL